jgi:RNA polymerase sigma-70 factor (ECF subfamily)
MAAPPAPSQLAEPDRADTPLASAAVDTAVAAEMVAPASRQAEHCRFVAQLFECYRRPLLRYVSGLLGRRGDAEDVLQEAYARLLAVSTLDRTPARARAYLFKTATNLVHDRFRRPEPTFDGASHEDAVADAAETPERIVDFEQGLDAVKRALLELKPRCRQVFLLRAAEGFDYDEIAARLRISRRTVEREMKHALDVCQQRLKRAWE